ncbi:uncharacterized protein LOC126259888 isoform X1 [Schistocerca nitens]|uniref:uncharacterized protein LOC126259888 isoform X1 n=1 Tax=Schistocerca nitens TaxID=7011 RepID=UPI0021184B9F|nr:uncharacterized protein LOC126259888 isoform X1 [Schistocerca nitens]
MKPKDIDTLLLLGSLDVNHSIFLYQFAVHWAQQGKKVLHISVRRYSQIPPQIHGLCSPGTEVFSLIRFVYLPTWQDLLKFLYTIHTHASIPYVILLEGLEDYCIMNDHSHKSTEKHENEMLNALICGSLLDAASVCAKYSKDKAVLVVSVKHDSPQASVVQTLVDTFFFNSVWLQNVEGENGEIIRMKSLVSYPSQEQRTVLEFECKSGGDVFLKKILKFFKQ